MKKIVEHFQRKLQLACLILLGAKLGAFSQKKIKNLLQTSAIVWMGFAGYWQSLHASSSAKMHPVCEKRSRFPITHTVIELKYAGSALKCE